MRATHHGPTPGRRDGGGDHAAGETSRRPNASGVLAVVLPLVTVGALLLAGPAPTPPGTRPPSEVPLARTSLVCPAPVADPANTEVGFAALADQVAGRLQQFLPRQESVTLPAGRLAAPGRLASETPVIVAAEGELAPGIVGGMWDAAGIIACARPDPQVWLTGLTAGPERATRLELVNPDAGAAVADLTVLGPTGELDASRLRGVRVPARSARSIDLGSVVPTEDDLSVHVAVVRGRLAVSALEVADPVGPRSPRRIRVPTQAEPEQTSWLLGLGVLDSDPVLYLANPSEDVARVSLRVVTDRTEFAPADVAEVQVPARSTQTVALGDELTPDTLRDALGLRLDASVPVTAALRAAGFAAGQTLVPAPPAGGLTGAVLPPGPKRLVVAGAQAQASIQITVRDGEGEKLTQRAIVVDPGRGTALPLPAAGQVLRVDLSNTTARVAVEMGRRSVLALAQVPLTGRAADVRPALR